MPTSVLLAVLVAAGLLALAPALVRRYDATERLDAERALSTARVLDRRRRRRTVPGSVPLNPARGNRAGPTPTRAPATPTRAPATPAPARPRTAQRPDPRDLVADRHWWRHRRRRVFGILVTLCAVEALGVAAVGPGFLAGLSLSGFLLCWYVAMLRRRVVQRRRDLIRWRMVAAQRRAAAAAERRRAAEKDRRIAESRSRAQELARRRAAIMAAHRAQEARRGHDDGEPGVPGLRGQSYEARAANF